MSWLDAGLVFVLVLLAVCWNEQRCLIRDMSETVNALRDLAHAAMRED